MLKKSVISLISYDSHYLINSIKSYYSYVDEIILGLDEDRISWSGNKFTFDEGALWSKLKEIDVRNKIQIIEHNFHSSSVPIENDNYERNYLKSHCSYDWIFSFDADETLVNAKEFFVDFLPIVERYNKKADLLFTWYLPYKRLIKTNETTGEQESYILMICNNDNTFFKGDTQGFVTNKDSVYTYARWTDKTELILSNLAIMHWSFCRQEDEVEQKINNYGHSDTKDKDPFFYNWKLVNWDNFQQLKNFKTSNFGNNQWEKLIPIREQDLFNIAREQSKLIL